MFTIRNTGNNNASAVNLAAIGSSFNYYGTSYATLFASTNGLITFGSGNTSASNTNLTTKPNQATLAPLWDDWINMTGQVMILGRYDDLNADGVLDRLIIEWNNVQGATTSPSAVTFQAILQLNTGTTPGEVIFNYVDLISGNFRNNGGSATVGIKAGGTQGGNRILVSQNNGAEPVRRQRQGDPRGVCSGRRRGRLARGAWAQCRLRHQAAPRRRFRRAW